MPENAGGDYLKKNSCTSKIEKFYVSIYQQLLGVRKNVSSLKILAELGRKPLKIKAKIQIFKYFQGFAFIETDLYVFKAFQEEITLKMDEQILWEIYIR